jgi:tetratricopeptide (TPR) repeat protein
MVVQLGAVSVPGSPGSAHAEPPRLDVLEHGGGGLPDRQQSMRRCTAWSYNLLAPEEQRVFRHLGVFIGGWEDAAATAIAGEIADGELRTVLGGLAAQHLIRREGGPGQATRFNMLETIRQYAAECLDASGAGDTVRERHAAYYLDLAEQACAHLRGADEERWLARLGQEHGNLRAALRWDAGASARAAQGVRLAGAIWRFWQIHGYRREGRAWLEHLLELAADAPVAWRARALHGAGILRYDLGDHAGARPLLAQALALRRSILDEEGAAGSLHGLGCVANYLGEYAHAAALFAESLALRQRRGDRRGTADTLSCLGNLAWEQGDYERAQELHEEALALLRAVGNRRGIATALGNLGLVAQTAGDLARARLLYEQGLAIHRAMGDKEGIARGVHNVGDVALEQGDHEAASRLLEEAVQLWRDVGHSLGQAYSLNSLGGLALQQRDHARAAARYRESLAIGREIGHKRGVADALEWLAIILSLRREAGEATRLFAAAAALRGTAGAARWPQAQAQYDGAVAAARNALGDDVFHKVWAEGAAMGFEQAIDHALGHRFLVLE